MQHTNLRRVQNFWKHFDNMPSLNSIRDFHLLLIQNILLNLLVFNTTIFVGWHMEQRFSTDVFILTKKMEKKEKLMSLYQI